MLEPVHNAEVVLKLFIMTAKKIINIVGVLHHIDAVMPVAKFLQKEADRGNLKPGMTVGIEVSKKTLEKYLKSERDADVRKIPIPARGEKAHVTITTHPTMYNYWRYLTGLLLNSGIKVVALVPGGFLDRDAQFGRARLAKAKTDAEILRYTLFERELVQVGTREKAIIEEIERLKPDYAVVGENHGPPIEAALKERGFDVRRPFQQKYPGHYRRTPEFKARLWRLENARTLYKQRKTLRTPRVK